MSERRIITRPEGVFSIKETSLGIEIEKDLRFRFVFDAAGNFLSLEDALRGRKFSLKEGED